MIPNTEHLIKWFWAAAEKQFGVLRNNKFCQCGTERIIHDSGNPPLARAFLLASVCIDQAMWHNPFCDYKAFARQFRFPQLEAHGGEGNVSAVIGLFIHTTDGIRKWIGNWGPAFSASWLMTSGHGSQSQLGEKQHFDISQNDLSG